LVDSANKATAHLFISNPFKKNKDFTTDLFSTHPNIKDRIKRLEEM
jgi:heat shock protein HtpX